jgi:midasin (ATPase involved in ribosome maturation)
MRNVARHVYRDFVDTFVSSFSRKQNAKFLQYAASMLDKANWTKLSQCFQRAAQLGLSKIKERGGKEIADSNTQSWKNFIRKAERFERQRVSCDSGLAFEFAEGALVDAIQSGKW